MKFLHAVVDFHGNCCWRDRDAPDRLSQRLE
jgi:hypothetical protein